MLVVIGTRCRRNRYRFQAVLRQSGRRGQCGQLVRVDQAGLAGDERLRRPLSGRQVCHHRFPVQPVRQPRTRFDGRDHERAQVRPPRQRFRAQDHGDEEDRR